MSIKLMSEAWGTSGLIASQKLVLLAFCDYANDDGECWPSHNKIAEKCDMSYENVRKVEQTLTKMNIISRVPQYRKDGFQMQNMVKITLKPSNEGVVTCGQGGGNTVPPWVVTQYHPCNHHINHHKEEPLFSLDEYPNPLLSFEALNSQFDVFWEAYPRKDDKSNTRKIWLKRKYSMHTFKIIMAAVESQFAGERKPGDLKFIPLPSTWLNKERYLDEIQQEFEEMPR